MRDLKLCEEVKKERDVLVTYNASLKNQNADEHAKRVSAETDRDHYKVKTKVRGKIIAAFVALELIRTGLQILIRR